ncbi:MAG: hemerythrin domain-containing protein [Gammaproteobacteria bacterium]
MPNAIDMLRQDHAGMRELLDLFALQVESMRSQEADPDYHLMYQIADFFVRFADAVHHPCEDRMYDLMRSHGHQLAQVLDGLAEEHLTLGAIGSDLRTRLKAAHAGQLTSRERLLESCTGFLQFQIHHMDVEERHLFPAAAQHLTDGELREIAEASHRDPNVTESAWLDARFERIRAALLDEVRGSIARPA